jgi:putative cardiolipin synthase
MSEWESHRLFFRFSVKPERPVVSLTITLIGICLLLITGCAGLPKNVNLNPSNAIRDGQETALGMALDKQLVDYQGQSGIFLLNNGLDAFVARALLTRMAERSIDLQYYEFHQDTVGHLLINELLIAADRGVRVRMLIDDMYGSEADDVWTALDAHPNIEVRLFNPFSRSVPKSLQWITRFKDLNHRMHSKSFTVDNQATILGGRNIGDEYFEANPKVAFVDLDVLAIGAVVPEASKAFDQYWNSDNAYPASVLARLATSEQLAELKDKIEQASQEKDTTRYVEALKSSEFARALRQGSARFEWAQARVMYDSPEKKARGENWESELLIAQLAPYLEKVTDELIIINPYFVPGKKGADALCKLSENGVKVSILTNSLASNDVTAVHAGYARYRKKLLKCGVVLYELNENIRKKPGNTHAWVPGLSKSSLHAKTMALDKKAMFVGSMNLDQRSLNINNEIGILFFNPEVASKRAQFFHENIETVAFRLALHANNNGSESIQWHLKEGDKEIVYDSEPHVGFWRKLKVGLIRLLPVESLL